MSVTLPFSIATKPKSADKTAPSPGRASFYYP
jgi:hypothetical protein